jgi:uncharacterized protein YjbI with pentapeptide repeats
MWLRHEFFAHTMLFASLVLIGGILIIAILYAAIPELRDGFWSGVFVEFTGMLFDIVIFGLLIAFWDRISDGRFEARRQQEIIDDFKKWNSDEARHRIAGAIRRLNRNGVTSIKFAGIELHDFSFRQHDIISIMGSSFHEGDWGYGGSRDKTVLKNVDFSSANCREVIFSPYVILRGMIVLTLVKDCKFIQSDLRGAVFKGTRLEWTAEHPEDLGIWHDDEEGGPFFEQTYYPAFWQANLKGASFSDAILKNVDFREAEGILECDFTDAQGLETCLFDNDQTKETILRRSQPASVPS